MWTSVWRLILRKHKSAIAAIAAASVAESILQIANLSMIIPFVLVILSSTSGDSVTTGATFAPIQRLLAGRPPFQAALWLAAAALILVVAKNALTVLRSYLAFMLYVAVRTDITLQLFARYLHARFSDLSQIARGTILYNLAQPPGQVADVTRAGSETLASIFQTLALSGLLLALSWRLTLVAGLTAGGSVLIYQLGFSRRIQRIRERIYDLDATAYQAAADAVDGVREVKAFTAEPVLTARLRALYAAIDGLERRHGRLRYVPGPLNEVVSTATALALFIAATFVPGFRIPAAFVVTFILALQRIGPAFANVIAQKATFDAARKSLTVTLDVLSTLPIESDAGRQELSARVSSVSLENVTYVYPSRDHAAALKNVSVTFKRGQVTAIVGPSGAGKSTLADLIVRLIEPTSGRLLADGMDVSGIALPAWRRAIGLVSQDPFLFNASLRDNIALARPSAPFEEIVQAAERARIDEFIRSLPLGYDTVVGNRGTQLSGGQRQRVAIARALLGRPSILVLDEATSALDNVSERLVRETIDEFRASAIVIVIAHRMSSVETADRILVLDGGELVSEGTHLELLRGGGLYGTMYPSLQKNAS